VRTARATVPAAAARTAQNGVRLESQPERLMQGPGEDRAVAAVLEGVDQALPGEDDLEDASVDTTGLRVRADERPGGAPGALGRLKNLLPAVADHLRIRRRSGTGPRGTLRSTGLCGGLPVRLEARSHSRVVAVFFSLPYFGFSTDTTRRTGLLPPEFGYGNNDGFYYKQPIYFAPYNEWDFQVDPQVRTRRGVGAYGAFRFVDSPDGKGEISFGAFKDGERMDVNKAIREFSVNRQKGNK